MSAHYDLIPLAQMWRPLPELREWMEKMGLAIPNDWQNSRNPAATEVRLVIRQLISENKISDEADFRVAGDDLDATIESEQDSTFLSIEDYARDCDEEAPRHISFQYGD